VATEIISSNNISFVNIKQDIDNFLKNSSNYQDIQDSLPASNITLIEELMASLGTYLDYKYTRNREETYLSKASLPSSIYTISSVFGYNINRVSAPVILVRYNDVPTLPIKNLDVFGEYQGYKLIYFGEDKLIEKGDFLQLYIGEPIKETVKIVLDEEGFFSYNVIPNTLQAVDKILYKYGNTIKEPTPNIEDFVVFNEVIQLSKDIFSLELFITDKNNRYGIDIQTNDELYIEYIETDGYIDTINTKDIKLNENFIYYQLSSKGTKGDSLSKIKRLAPLLYSTMRRMVTNKDHSFLINANKYIKSCYVESDKGEPIKYQLTISDASRTEITINGFTFVSIETIASEIARDLYQQIDHSYLKVNVSYIDNNLYLEGLSGFDEYTFILPDNIESSIIKQPVKPLCCTNLVYYIKYNTVDTPISLTDYEMTSISSYCDMYKLGGVRLIFVTAQKINAYLDIKISLYDNQKQEIIIDKIKDYMKQYELILGVDFSYTKVLADIANIEDENGRLISNIYPNQDEFNYNTEDTKDKYLKFSYNIIFI